MVIKVHNLDKCLKKLGDLSKIDLSPAVQFSAIAIQSNARKRVPVDTAQLQKSISYKPIDGDYNIGARIFAQTEYAYWVEFGTSKPHFVPFVTRSGEETGLRGWAERHGFDTTKMNGLVVSGKPQPFLAPAFKEERKEARDRIVNYAQKHIDKLGRG